MAAQKGKDLLLKVDTTGTGSFSTVAGLRSRSIAFNAETVDITHAESARSASPTHLNGRKTELFSSTSARTANGMTDMPRRRFTWAGVLSNGTSSVNIRTRRRNSSFIAGADIVRRWRRICSRKWAIRTCGRWPGGGQRGRKPRRR